MSVQLSSEQVLIGAAVLFYLIAGATIYRNILSTRRANKLLKELEDLLDD